METLVAPALDATVEAQDFEKPMPGLNHSLVQAKLVTILMPRQTSNLCILSELDLELNGRRVRPDICVYPRLEPNWLKEIPRMTEPPLLAVEIDSAEQGTQSFAEKLDIYFSGGVKTVWRVQPSVQAIAAFTPDRAKPQVVSTGQLRDPATGLSVNVEEVFSV